MDGIIVALHEHFCYRRSTAEVSIDLEWGVLTEQVGATPGDE